MFKHALITLAATALIAAAVPTNAQDQTNGAPQMIAPTTSGHAPVNGIDLYYAVYSEGEPLVLLHGGFGMIEMFGPNLAALTEGRQVIGVDLRGHGRTLPTEGPLSFSDLAADVAGLMQHLGIAKADVMGYSLGGQTALRLAIEHPEVVDKLVLASTPYAYAGWQDFNQQSMKQIGPASAEGMKQTPMYQAYAALAQDPETNWPKLHAQMGRLVGAEYDWSADLGKITAPTLIVVGDWDSVRITHATDFFSKLGGGAQDGGWDGSGMNQNRFAVLPSTTHYGIFMDPRLAQSVIPFLDAK